MWLGTEVYTDTHVSHGKYSMFSSCICNYQEAALTTGGETGRGTLQPHGSVLNSTQEQVVLSLPEREGR